jgi:signal transduction histidine kinase
VFLSRNVPAQGEAFFTFVGGRPHRETYAPGVDAPSVAQISAAAADGSGSGEFEAEGRRIRYLAVPVNVDGARGGAFVVTSDLSSEIDQVNSDLRVAAGIALGVFLIASLLAWVVAGRVLAPLRVLRDTARSITESDLTRRIPVDEQQQVVHEPAHAVELVGHELDRLGALLGIVFEQLEVPAHDRDRRAQLVAGVADELLLARERILEPVEHLVEGAREVGELVVALKAQRPDFLQPEPIEAGEFTRELFAKASALAGRDWRLGEVASGRIVADRQRLTQAVMNLSQNAVNHTNERDAVELGSTIRNGHVRLWVRDTGAGVSEGDREHIFERFARGSEASRADGSGLGLAITQAIAEAHNGSVELDSRPGAGARFTVVIPTKPSKEVGVP